MNYKKELLDKMDQLGWEILILTVGGIIGSIVLASILGKIFLNEIKNEKALEGYDAYVFGSPTYHRDMTGGMKTFLFLGQKLNLVGKVAGAFGSYTHSGDAPKIILDTMQHVFKMDISDLGSFNLLEDGVGTDEGLRACQDYGKAVGEKLAG